MTTLHTTRLRLEPFAERHVEGINAMNSQPVVVRYLSGQTETLEQTAQAIARAQKCWAAWGTSWWALIDLESERVAGAGCVQYLRRELAMPTDLQSLCGNPLEFGWRLHPDFWRRGLATEAGGAMARFAFASFPIEELLAVRRPENQESARVMDRLGMKYRGMERWYETDVAVHVLRREELPPPSALAGEA